MPPYRNTPALVAADKCRRPELYCPTPHCLWYTRGGPCPRHKRRDNMADLLTDEKCDAVRTWENRR